MAVEHVVVEADGGSRGNPGPAGYGAVVLDAATRGVLAERKAAIGIQTNNVAEYRGLIAGLRLAAELGARRVSVRMDSKLVIEQMSGRWQVRHPAMRPLAREASELRRHFEDISFEWIPRERNKHADRLANEAMDQAAGIEPHPARADAYDTPGHVSDAAGTAPSLWAPSTQPPTRFVLVRHGATAHSALRRFSGHNDLALDETGERQAEALAGRATSFGDVAAVFSSPLRRTVQTAEPIAAALGLGVQTVDDLAETDFGAWEGMTFAEANAAWPTELAAWHASVDVAPPGGESTASVTRRVRRGRDAVIAARPEATVVVVTHVTPIKILVRLALDAPPVALFRIHLDTASVTLLDYFADGNASLRLLNDTGHLRS